MKQEIDHQRFEQLTSQWQDGTIYSSSPTEILEHPSLQEIISYGEDVIPLILETYKNNPDMGWGLALHQITGIVPPGFKEEEAGDTIKLRDAWIQWGLQNSYIQDTESTA